MVETLKIHPNSEAAQVMRGNLHILKIAINYADSTGNTSQKVRVEEKFKKEKAKLDKKLTSN